MLPTLKAARRVGRAIVLHSLSLAVGFLNLQSAKRISKLRAHAQPPGVIRYTAETHDVDCGSNHSVSRVAWAWIARPGSPTLHQQNFVNFFFKIKIPDVTRAYVTVERNVIRNISDGHLFKLKWMLGKFEYLKILTCGCSLDQFGQSRTIAPCIHRISKTIIPAHRVQCGAYCGERHCGCQLVLAAEI